MGKIISNVKMNAAAVNTELGLGQFNDDTTNNTEPSCRRMSLKCVILLLTFIIIVLNLTFDFMKDILDNRQLWSNIQAIRSSLAYIKNDFSNTTKV